MVRRAVRKIEILTVMALGTWFVYALLLKKREQLVFVATWTALILLLYFAGKLAICQLKKARYLHSSIGKIDNMTGIEFEECLKVHFEKLGYKVETTPATADYGVDLICKKKKECFVVQAKRYGRKIGISAVQQVIGGMQYYDCDKGMVITNNYFTKNAYELAKKSNVELWDRDDLIGRLKIKEIKICKIQ